jgi:hypothetical protein
MRDLFYSALVLIPLALGAWLTLHRKKVLLPLLILFIAGWWLQTGIGYLEGDGFQAFGARYFNTYHRAYPYFASQNQLSIAENIRSYEDNLAKSLFTSTKPPGLMTFYFLTESIVNGNPTASVYSPEVRQARLTNFITFAFPIFAALAVFLIFAFGRRFISPGSFPVLPAFLYVLSPNVVMFSLFIDQALYPAVFLAGSWLTFRLLACRSLLLAFLLGMLLYLFAFFAFTMLPLFVLAAIYIALLWWQNPQKYPLIRQIKTGLLFLSGVFSSYWLMRWFFQYDFFPRFAKTMQVNHQFDFYERIGITPTTLPEPFLLRLQQIFQALWWNNLEFATTVGVAVYLLFLIYGIRLIVQLARRQSTPSGIVLSSFFLAFLALNAAGSAQGEIARLWLFWVPMVVIFASLELYRWAQKRPYLFYALLLAQFVTFMLTYHFQELKM